MTGRSTRFRSLFVCAAVSALSLGASAAERKEVRMIYDFEDIADFQELKANCEGVDPDVVSDNGVTGGRNCCRVAARSGVEYAVLEIKGEKIRNWGDFDYFAIDVFSQRPETIRLVLELWDKASKDYATRCTFEDAKLHPGANRLLWRIDRAKRNNKEGRSWEELEPKDKIDRNDLAKVKLFFMPPKEGATMIWIDRLRVLQEDAAGGKVQVKLPEGCLAFDFGNQGQTAPGFTWVGPKGEGVGGLGVVAIGKAWPDSLAGKGLYSVSGEVGYAAKAPADGEYCVWVCAGRIYNEENHWLPHEMRIGDKVLFKEALTEKEFFGEKGIFRCMRTQYSQRPNALWLDYAQPEATEYVAKAQVKGGVLSVRCSNHRLSAMIAMPASQEAAFNKLTEEIRAQRIKMFYGQLYFDKHDPPKKEAGDGAYVLWVPRFTNTIRPWTGPSAEERKTARLDLKGAIGQRVIGRVCVTSFEDLGKGDIEISDLKGPGTIPATAFRRYYQNYRMEGTSPVEMALLPWTNIRFEKDITWAYWLWLRIPDDAAPGVYEGTITFKPEQGGAKALPVSLEAYPFQLEQDLPVAYGMYYSPWEFPSGLAVDVRKVTTEQFRLMREFGLNATTMGSGSVRDAGANGTVEVRFNPMLWEAAKAAGFGRHPDQRLMASSLSMARRLSNLMFFNEDESLGRNHVDRNPGVEFTRPWLRACYKNALGQYKAFYEKFGLPVAMEVVDEPREMPNPWNRTRDQTARYADWMGEVGGITSLVTMMGDTNAGKDYTALVEHADIISVHATRNSARLVQKARELGKTLWIYNAGMDRFSWGFYNWRMGSKGRWEWHWCWAEEGGAVEAFPNPKEWYTPFSGRDGYALHAPYFEYPGACLFKSAYLDVAAGITDYAYLHTLEKAIEAARSDPARAKPAQEARTFLDGLKKAIPEFAEVKGLASPEAGALVGAGVDTPVKELAETWQRRIAELLIALKRKEVRP